MAYIIKRTDGQLIFENGLQENIIDNETLPVALIGRLTPDYGSYQSNNFIHLMEHFANETAPDNAIKGTLWYNTTNESLYVCIAENPLVWYKLAIIKTKVPLTPETGDLYYNTETHKLFIYDDGLSQWVNMGPADATNVDEGVLTTVTDSNNPTSFVKLTLPTTSVINLELHIVARENLNNSEIGVRSPECASWIIKSCLNSYKNEVEGVMVNSISVVGNPSQERIASTDNALNWENSITANTNDSTININVGGVGIYGTDNVGEVNWTIYYHFVKA